MRRNNGSCASRGRGAAALIFEDSIENVRVGIIDFTLKEALKEP